MEDSMKLTSEKERQAFKDYIQAYKNSLELQYKNAIRNLINYD